MGLDVKTLAAAKKYAKETSEGSGTITVDTSMSDISENPVQNKVIKKYVDDKSIVTSKKEGNTLTFEEDGLYNPEITDSQKKDIANKILKDMEKGLVAGYICLGYYGLISSNPSLNTKEDINIIPYYKNAYSTNFDENKYSINEGWILLKAGKTYELSGSISVQAASAFTIQSAIMNYDTNELISYGSAENNSGYINSILSIIICPEEDIRINFIIRKYSLGNANYTLLQGASYFIVKELNQYESPIMTKSELDSCYCNLDAMYTLIADEYVPFKRVSGNMEVIDGKVKVKPRQRVQIIITISYTGTNSYANIGYFIKDYTNDINIIPFHPSRINGYNEFSYTISCQYTNETNEDCYIGLYTNAISTNDALHPTLTTMTIQEIGKALVIKKDSGTANLEISREENNAIEEKEDGIFVQDQTRNIALIQNQIVNVKKYRRYVNTDLDSAFCLLQDNNYTTVTGQYVPFVLQTGNMEVVDGKVRIRPRERVNIEIVIAYSKSSAAANVHYQIKDDTNNIVIISFAPFNSITTAHEAGHTTGCQYTNETDEDCWLGLYVGYAYTATNIVKSYSYLKVTEIGHNTVIDPIEHTNTTKGIEDTPVGHIISYMGNNPPKHYLNCDGTQYNISEYPYLAEHIKTEFGTYEHFGGDGITTFAVPDLRGEFLRGTGENGHEKCGNGADVGEHQDGTSMLRNPTNIGSGSNYIAFSCFDGSNDFAHNMDFTEDLGSTPNYVNYTGSRTRGNEFRYQSRPTNTSVLYCIKYEPTYFMKFEGKDRYSTDEIIIGEWIDGKPIYRKVIQTNAKIPVVNTELNIPVDIDNINEVINYYGMCCINGRYQKLPYNTASNTNIQMTITDINPCNIMLKVSATGSVGMNISYLTVEYTKSTD